MKIVIISPAHPLRGGIAALSERLAGALMEAGHEVVIYSFSLQYPAFLFPGKSQTSDDPPPPRLRIQTRINSVNPFNWWSVGRAIAAEQPDQVIVRYWLPFMGPCLGSILRVMRWFLSKKTRVTGLVDNIIPHEKRPGDRIFSQYFASACDDFLTMSQAVMSDLRQFSKRPARWAPHPVYDQYGDPETPAEARALLGLPEKAPLALFFGFIRAYKGLDLLLEALALAPEVQLVIAGEPYESWAPYQEIIERHGLKNRLHLFTDFIPSEQVRLFFSAADLVVQPYKTATQSGISQIAYHFDKPMLVTRVGGLPEIVKDGVSGYVTEADPVAIAQALNDFFQNQRAEQMRPGVQKEKERFSWGYFLTRLLENQE